MSRVFAIFPGDGTWGFYPEFAYPSAEDGTRNENIPAEAIEISQADYDQSISDMSYRRWENGKLVEFTPPEPEIVFPVLSKRQFGRMLIELGIDRDVLVAQINAIYTGKELAIALNDFNEATQYERTHPLVGALGSQLGYTPKQMDTYWMTASTF